ncbi:exported protein of unknown function (plasmid) [Azospirillum lipoferum 4B]|uniref:Uncharacterized protein n=1 Tax=Azospirillum lipoferum (strain 4B) TaxID=862719 RepID=G7ZJ34_AZOL4|nr:exported protein of unknown function [Azospirillum lipoferum 4B]
MTFSTRALIARKSAKLTSPAIFSCTGGLAGVSATPFIFETACDDSDTVSLTGFFPAGAGNAVEGAAAGDAAEGVAEGSWEAGAAFSFASNESADMAPSCATFVTMLPLPTGYV